MCLLIFIFLFCLINIRCLVLGFLGIKFLRGGIIFFVFIYGEVGNYLDFLELLEWLLD